MSLKVLSAALFIFTILFTSCEKEAYQISDLENSSEVFSKKPVNPGNGNGKPDKGDDPVEPDPFVATYRLVQADDNDPLYQFSISQSGTLMLLETDPTVTSWGTDYWGYWSNPYPFQNNQVNYTIGLTETTYEFTPLAGDRYDVVKTLIQHPYLGGTSTTTVSHPGVYELVN